MSECTSIQVKDSLITRKTSYRHLRGVVRLVHVDPSSLELRWPQWASKIVVLSGH